MRAWFAVCALLAAFGAVADERILEFRSDIVIEQDGWIEVTETIRVRAEGNRIQRGIYRDFPTTYFDRLGNRYEVDFQPLAVLRNGSSEDYHTQGIRDGRRVYFGHENRFLNHGEHTYEFRYRASRMLGFFEAHDELYWNVTGFDWAFPIDAASATVRFRFDVAPRDITTDAYTGPFGATQKNFDASVDGNGVATFVSTRPLSAVNGLTIVVGWPKGFIEPPSSVDRFGWLLKDNLNLLIALAGFCALLIYYVPIWRNFGKDPEPGVIVPRYGPPDSFSPASLRFIRQMYYDDKVMTAAIVNLAVKGYLRIELDEGSEGFLGLLGAKDATYTLVRRNPAGNPQPLAAGEEELYEALFRTSTSVELKNKNHARLGQAKRAHKESLTRDYKERFFVMNGRYNVAPIFILVGTALASLRFGPSIPVIGVLVLMLVATVWFASIMKTPTLRGRKLLDEVLGFKDFLEVAEKDELNLRNPPEKTPELFERYLPYALALGVDQQWSEKFASVLAAVQGPNGNAWQPTWYNGQWTGQSLGVTTSRLSNSLNSAVSSSVRPPGSSSGGGGGGSSGGGGGGGGGGGW